MSEDVFSLLAVIASIALVRAINRKFGALMPVVYGVLIFAGVVWVASIQRGGLWENLGVVLFFVLLIGGTVFGGLALLTRVSSSPTRIDWDEYDSTKDEAVESASTPNETPQQ